MNSPPDALPDRPVLTNAPPTVTGAIRQGRQVTLWFDQPMDVSATADAATLWRLTEHAFGDLSVAADAVPSDLRWPSPQRLRFRLPAAAGSYVMAIGDAARNAAGVRFDGATERAVADAIHRPQDDGAGLPRAYRTQVMPVGGALRPDFSGLPPRAYLMLTDVTVWHGNTASGPRDRRPEVLWQFGQARINRFPPDNELPGFRLTLTSPAGGPFALVGPGSVGDAVDLLSAEQGDVLGRGLRLDLSQTPSAPWQPLRTQVVAADGLDVTVEDAPNANLATMRKADDPTYLLLGDLPPRGIVARIASFDRGARTYRLVPRTRSVTASVAGTAATTQRAWPEGALDGGFSLVFPGGEEIPIVRARGRRITLAAPGPAGTCDCTVALRRLEERVFPGTEVATTGHHWYLHLDRTQQLRPGRIFLLVFNPRNTVRSLMGTPFFDRERDGDERPAETRIDDAFILQFVWRDPNEARLAVSRINDGILYPTAFDNAGLDCLGASTAAVCAHASAVSSCGGESTSASASFSFYTNDGLADNSLGSTDLLELAALRPDDVTLRDRQGRLLPTRVRTRTVLHATPAGDFPTTLMTLQLVDASVRCPDGSAGVRGFQPGDRMTVDHGIPLRVNADADTLDGNGDGVASAFALDDWVGVWRPQKQTFVPLVRKPRPFSEEQF